MITVKDSDEGSGSRGVKKEAVYRDDFVEALTCLEMMTLIFPGAKSPVDAKLGMSASCARRDTQRRFECANLCVLVLGGTITLRRK